MDLDFVALLDCLANPSRECLATPLLLVIAVGAFLFAAATAWLLPSARSNRIFRILLVGALCPLLAGALAVFGFHVVRANPRWLGPVTENLGSLAFVLLSVGVVALAFAFGFGLGGLLARIVGHSGQSGTTR